MSDDRCKQNVYSDSIGWRSRRCESKAVTHAGYCRLHDPDLRAEREKKRPPVKWERKHAVRKLVEAAIERKLGRQWVDAIRLYAFEHADVPWPLPQWLVDMCADVKEEA